MKGTAGASEVTIDQVIYNLRIDLHDTHRETFGGAEDRANEYALCHAELEGLRPLDYSLLAALAYFNDNRTFVQHVLPRLFPPAGTALLVDDETECTSMVREFENFFVVEFPKQKLSVITVRGTDPSRVMDIITDLRLWAEAALLQLAGVFVPTVRLWPHDLTSDVVKPVDCSQNTLRTLKRISQLWHGR